MEKKSLNDPNAICPICNTREPENHSGQFPFEHKCKETRGKHWIDRIIERIEQDKEKEK